MYKRQVLIAPTVQIYTATHPIELNERLTPVETAEGMEYIRHTLSLIHIFAWQISLLD